MAAFASIIVSKKNTNVLKFKPKLLSLLLMLLFCLLNALT